MAIPEAGRIGEQHSAYRKGLVLGLTMAEAAILIIFVLLLLIAFEGMQREETLQEFRGKSAITPQRLRQLEDAEHTLQVTAEELGVGPDTPSDDFRHLARIVQVVARSGPGQTALTEAKEEIEKLRTTSKALEKALAGTNSTGAETVVRQLEQQSYKIANQEGQLKNYERKLASVGQGKDERPCWVRPDGTIDFLYDVVLASGGIRMREYIHPHRVAERSHLPMPVVDPREILTPGEFIRRTRPIFDRSVAENCRFFVVIYDATPTHEKPLYKSLLKTVEGHFYKRLDDASAPF